MYDMNNMKKLKKLEELAPAAWQGFLAFDKAVMTDGAIPTKTKELIAIAVAMTTQCPYCIEIHSKNAKKAGCSEAAPVAGSFANTSRRADAAAWAVRPGRTG